MKLFQKTISIFTVNALLLGTLPIVPIQVNAQETTDIFYDDFSSGTLDPDKWLVAHKNWGGKITENGKKVDYNGGVIPENVTLTDGKLILNGNGNLYEGDVKGINKDGSTRSNGKKTGSAIATKEYYASGSYEVYAKVAPELGACSAIWTFEYEEDWNTGAITNHEIDIEMPGRPKAEKKNQSFEYALCNTWIGENEGEYKTGYTDIGVNQADGEFHKYRFDWHTGDANETPRVEFYFDDVLTYTSYDYIPTNAGRLWLGLWFPNAWAGVPNFDTTAFEIDYVKITPFHESGDTPQNETYPEDGWGDIDAIKQEAHYAIDIYEMPKKLTYAIGEELDLTGLKLQGEERIGLQIGCILGQDYQELLDSSMPFSIDSSEYDSTKAGTYKIYLTLGNATTSFDVTVTGNLQGDVNADGDVNVVDAILLQKWLLAVPDVKLADWKAGDFTNDNQLTIFDLCLLKKQLLETKKN